MGVTVAKQWSTPSALVGCGWSLAVAAIIWWLLSTNGPDRLFVGVVVIVLVATSTFGTLARPRLCADADGVAIRGLRGERRWPWSAVSVRVRANKRFGVRNALLEIDVDEQLILLSKLDLGEDPEDVAAELDQLRG